MNNDISEDKKFNEIYSQCKDCTMTSVERAYSLYKAVEYIIVNNIEGDFVECGVWKGGSVMIMAKTLLLFGKNNRKIFMFDTFEGMSNPEDVDKDIENQEAKVLLETSDKNSSFVWSYATENEVRKIYY